MVHRLILSYRGAAYAGWQRQENALAVQQVGEEALARLLAPGERRSAEAGARPLRVGGAGRTDAGGQARAQAAHLEPAAGAALALPRPASLRALVHGVNHFLPADVRVMAAHRVAAGFHARKHAAGKVYLYRLRRAAVLSPLDAPFVVRAAADLDLAAMRRAAAALPGRHDFSAFALAGGGHRQPWRRIGAAEWLEEAGELRFRIAGEGFLRGMVRSLVGTMIEVGRGRRSPEAFLELLAGAPRAAAGPTAPAHGLSLEEVVYPERWRAIEAYPG
ncbi:MAG TPA: tRNA pseudouridine(38-40) synthase TruA [Thermoanaerobaculia bacterium]|nr:tRNA pseudouridine(38-40) synthase TruA [Thermoanaerobaculia bacterium]